MAAIGRKRFKAHPQERVRERFKRDGAAATAVPLSWKSSKISRKLESPLEAELYALQTGVSELVGAVNTLREIGLCAARPLVVTDSSALYQWINSNTVPKNKRHIVAIEGIRESIKRGSIEIRYVESSKNPADGLTKAQKKLKRPSALDRLVLENKVFF